MNLLSEATYHKKGLFGKQEHAKFYVAGVLVAFHHLHGKKIVFRDLKPENLLLNDTGHIKLTDMGLAKAHDISLSIKISI